MNDALAALDELNAHPYDGVRGTLPDWMPAPLVNEFTMIRFDLLGGKCPDCARTHTSAEVRKWLAAYRKPARPHRARRTFPTVHAGELRELAHIQDVARLGSKLG